MGNIRIGTPRIISGDRTQRLEADISWQYADEQIHETVYYEVDNKWGEYLTSERSDPFILAMFEIAIDKGYDIEYEAPMSEDLKYQLETYVIPVYIRKAPKKCGLKSFRLVGETATSRIDSKGITGTGFSAGVDSFYTVLKHIDSPYKSKKISHLLLTLNGSAVTGVNRELDKEWFDEEMKLFSPIADELGLELIGVDSNSSLLGHYRDNFKGGSCISTLGFVYALRKLFGTYYWASAYEADVIGFPAEDLTSFAEPFLLTMLSIDGLRFYHSGCEVNRCEKVEYIADNPIVQKSLTVCGQPKSCGVCMKCTRTMAELYSIDKLDKFSKIFPDTENYTKKLSRNLGRELANDHPPFTTEIFESFRKNGKRFPSLAYLWKWCWFKPLFALKKKFKYNRFFMKLYYDMGWLERIGEKRPREDIIIGKKSGKRYEK